MAKAEITHLTVQNFKSLRAIENFELRSLNIFIGRNGAGKSNVLHFFRLLREAADERLFAAINQLGGMGEILWRAGSQRGEALAWELTFNDQNQIRSPIYFSGTIAPRGAGYHVSREEVSRPPYPGYENRFFYVGVYNGAIRYLTEKPSTTDLTQVEVNIPEPNSDELLIARLRQDPTGRYGIQNELRSLLTDWVIFRGFGENALAHIASPQDPEIRAPLRLRPDGSNLAGVIHTLSNDYAYADTWEKLEEVLREAFPDFRRLTTPSVSGGKLTLEWRSGQGQFKALSLSDGMLRFLGLATLLLLPDPPPLIAIDEPEIGLHPRLIPLLGSLLRRAAHRTQIVVTTHSPLLLNTEGISPDDVVVVEADETGTHLRRLDPAALRLWLERFTLGSLWTMGRLEQD